MKKSMRGANIKETDVAFLLVAMSKSVAFLLVAMSKSVAFLLPK